MSFLLLLTGATFSEPSVVFRFQFSENLIKKEIFAVDILIVNC